MMQNKANNFASIIRILTVTVTLLNCLVASANTTNFIEIGGTKTENQKIKIVFPADEKLTKQEIIQVVKLAKQNGLNNPNEIRVFHFIPGGGKGITVKSTELHDGRNTRFDTVYIYKVGWSSMETNSTTKFVGEFWIDQGSRFPTLLRDYKSTNGTAFQVSIGKGVDIHLADTVVSLLVADKLQFLKNIAEDNVFRRRLSKRGDAMPKLIHKRESENDYELELDNYPTTVLEFKSENGKIIVTSISEYVI